MLDFKAAIFDLDGTLLDSLGVWDIVNERFLKSHNLPVPEDYSDAISTLSFLEAARYTKGCFGLKEAPEDIVRQWLELAADAYAREVMLKPGARDYLLKLKSLEVKLAVATASHRALFEPTLKRNGVFSLFDTICSADETSRSKEYPDIFLLAAKKLKVRPDDCIVFEDIAPAISSAKCCGMTAFGFFDKANISRLDSVVAASDGFLTSWHDAPLPCRIDKPFE
jgi:HAD superfamily hydrolase (TIGR01509 family)